MADTKMKLVDWLDDLCVRFIINLPKEELESVERICFQIEEAHWFYEDFIRPLDSTLPSMNLKQFCVLIFQHCPLFSEYSQTHFMAAYSEFLAYKTRVPVRGAILLNEAMDEVVLVKGWKKGARWSFPRGKINKDENDLACAIREVYEETGFDAKAAGLVGEESQMKYIEVSMREQHMRLYVIPGVPMDTHFEPRTRKEISKIDWYKLSELPTLRRQKQAQQGTGESLLRDNMFYMVAPFLGPLKHWIKQQIKRGRRGHAQTANMMPVTETETEEDLLQAEESTAEDGMAPHPEMPDTHFDRLLAGLRNPAPLPDTTNLPEVSSPPEAVPDLAAELKRLLSVNKPGLIPMPAGNTAPSAPSSNPLLAMLQGNSGQSLPNRGNSVPCTPFEQVTSSIPVPDAPHGRHRPREPQFSSMAPPPAFPFPPVHQLPTHPIHVHQAQNNSYQSGPANNMPPPPVPGYRPPQLSHVMQQRQPQPPRFPMQDARQPQGYPQVSAEAPRPYHRTGDPQFAQGPQSAGSQGPAIPPASKLPPPKLTPHTMNLLNAFKNGAKPVPPPPSQPTIKPFTHAAEIYKPIGTQQQSISKPARPITEVSELAGTQPTPGNDYVDGQPPPVSPVATRPRNSQQESLLNLFRSPSISAASPAASQTQLQALTQEPVELSAQSPTIPRKSLEKSGVQQSSLPALDTTAHAKAQPPGLTSATVSGPLNEPNFDTLRKKKPAELNGRSSPRTRGPKTRLDQPQFSILTRSRPEASATPSPKQTVPPLAHRGSPVPRNSPGPRSFNNSPKPSAEAPKPFTPQILRRPQSSAAPTQSSERSESIVSDQKTTLLSLFGKSETASPQAIPSGILSPVSPLPDKQAQIGSSGERSRISSIASIPAEGGLGTRSARGSMSGAPASPATPVDKNFLLGYLNGVVKGAGK